MGRRLQVFISLWTKISHISFHKKIPPLSLQVQPFLDGSLKYPKGFPPIFRTEHIWLTSFSPVGEDNLTRLELQTFLKIGDIEQMKQRMRQSYKMSIF